MIRKIIFKTNNEIEATLVKHQLENEGVSVYMDHEHLKAVFNGISGSAATIEILVDEENFDKAQNILKTIQEDARESES